MVKFFNRLGTGARMAVCTLTAGFAVGAQQAMAQDYGNLGKDILNGTQQSIADLVTDIIGVVQVLLAVAAIVSLFVVIYNIWKQERDAAQKAIWWVVGLAAGWAALTVIGNLVGRGA